MGSDNVLPGSAQQEWADADYMLALITVNLFNSPDWFGMVYEALGEGRRVIPIRIQRADYEGTGLEKLRSLPTQNRAVSDFANADDLCRYCLRIKRLLLNRNLFRAENLCQICEKEICVKSVRNKNFYSMVYQLG
ncbi:MAG: hypothetical protein R2778_00500 [Saprospiraceae bacterium]